MGHGLIVGLQVVTLACVAGAVSLGIWFIRKAKKFEKRMEATSEKMKAAAAAAMAVINS